VATSTTSNPRRPFRRAMAEASLLVLIWDAVVDMKGRNRTSDVTVGMRWRYFTFGNKYLPGTWTMSPLELATVIRKT
jgi:hypothetical protein